MLRCEDCIPLIEEYFDGEVDTKTNEGMSAHISACADCAAALDALSFEGEIFARYERGLEPTPALWARVSADIAREARIETPAERRPFLSRAFEAIASALGALTLRPALASSLALLVIGVAIGSLWLAYRPKLVNNPADRAGNDPNNIKSGNGSVEIANVPANIKPRAGREPKASIKEGGLSEEDIRTLLNGGQQSSAPNAAAVKPDAGDHAEPDAIAGLIDAPKAYAGLVNASAQMQLPDAGEKEMARHVEQTQMLLRSIKNARASDEGGTINVAYEKNLSRRLLADNATLKLEAEVKGDKDTKQVLDTIEPFLLDIANMREHASREEVRSIRERVKKTEIIASLQVY